MKKFFKNNLKTILAVGATAVICTSGTAFAAFQYQANSVSYTTAKNEGIKNVEEALNDLYNKTYGTTWIDISDKLQVTANNTTSKYKLYKCGNVVKLILSGNFGGGTTEKNIGKILDDSLFPSSKINNNGCGSDSYYAILYVDQNGNISVKQAKDSGSWFSGDLTWICNGN